MNRYALGALKHTAWIVGYGLTGAAVVLFAGFVWFVNDKPDLSVWHTADLDEEFRADSGVESFADYLALEERLFAQLESEVFDRLEPSQRTAINRFNRGSLCDPGRWPRNWNRSFELPVDAPKAGAVLLHGMSDSPYSLHNQAARLHAAGLWVVGLRIPGHGTAPVGLTDVRWEDMAAAVELAVRHVAERVGDRPLFLMGYSNGGALAVHYAQVALEDDSLPEPDGLVLLSPEIGLSEVAAFAEWQEAIGDVLGLEKLEWTGILPEYDPFKYQSFAVNAGTQAYRITVEIGRRFEALHAAGRLEAFPPTLAFQSAVDATVSTPAVISGLMDRLPAGEHELVLFDLNRVTDIEAILKHDPRDELTALLRASQRHFTITVVTNEDESTTRTVVRQIAPGESQATQTPLDVEWPRGVFSLSHVALPFPPTDPLYGNGSGPPSPGIHLGELALRGERGVLQVTSGDMLRQRWNPFHPYVERRILDFVDGS